MLNTNYKKTILHLAISALLFPINAVQAEETSTLDEIEVSTVSAGKGSNVEKMDVSTTVITKEQIQKNPQISIDQMLNREMGIWTSQVPANQVDFTGAVIGMRGFGNKGGEKVLVTVDGVPMNDGYFRTIDWNQIPKDTIEKIEIIRGGGGASLWGNLAEGGVINIITREPKADEKRIGFAYGSFNTKVGDAAATLFSNDALKIGLNLNTIESDGYNTAPKNLQVSPNLVATDTRTHNALISSYFTPNDQQKWFVKIGLHELLQDHANYDVANNQWYKYDYRGGGQIKYSNTGSVNLNSFYDYSQMHKVNGSLIRLGSKTSSGDTAMNIDVTKPVTIAASGQMATQREVIDYQSYGTSAYIQEQFKGSWGTLHDVKIGIDARGIEAIDNNNLYSQITNNSNGVYSTNGYPLTYTNNSFKSGQLDNSGRNLFEGIFAQATYSPNDIPLDITIGLRQDWWQSFNGKIANTSIFSPTATPQNSSAKVKDQFFDQFNPRAGIKYSFENGIDIRAAAYRNFAAPGFNQLYRSFVSGKNLTQGNSSLTPESNFGQEIGIDFTGKTIKTRFTLFHNQLENYILSATTCSSNCIVQGFSQTFDTVKQNLNIGGATMEGGEAFVEWQALDTLKLNASVVRTIAFIDNFTRAIPSSVALSSKQIPDVPTLVLTLGGAWNITPDLEFGWSIKSWPDYWTSTVVTNLSAQTEQGATTADLNLNYQATKQLELYVTAQNVSDAYYIATNRDTSTTTPASIGMPRNVLGGFRLSF